MNVVITNSPVIPSGAEAGLASTGTYLPDVIANRWYILTVGGEGGAIYLEHNGTGWQLYSTYDVVIVQSNPVAITVPPWQATWPSPMVVALETTSEFQRVANLHGGVSKFIRKRLLGYF